jgi:hypothetical protein
MTPMDLLEYPASPPTQLSTTTSSSIILPYSVSEIGRSVNSQDIQHLHFPSISSPVELKFPAVNFFSDSVKPYLRNSPFTEISTSHVECSCLVWLCVTGSARRLCDFYSRSRLPRLQRRPHYSQFLHLSDAVQHLYPCSYILSLPPKIWLPNASDRYHAPD